MFFMTKEKTEPERKINNKRKTRFFYRKVGPPPPHKRTYLRLEKDPPKYFTPQKK